MIIRTVIPAHAGIYALPFYLAHVTKAVDPGMRRDDSGGI